MFAGTKRVHIHPCDDPTRHLLGSDGPAARRWEGGVEVYNIGESNAGIRHYSDIQCCQRASLLHGQED